MMPRGARGARVAWSNRPRSPDERSRRVSAGGRVPRRDRTHGPGVQPGLAATDPGQGRRAERDVRRARRRRLRAAELLRRPGRDAEHRSGRRLGPALREHAHDRAVLADAREHPDRPQPPLQRRRLHHGAGHRLPGLRRADAVRERDAARDARAGGLQHVLPRQVAPVARGGEHAGRPVPPLAARPRLRALLRLPRRRDQPVVSRPDAGQQPDAPAEGPRGRLPPQRGPGRPGDQDGRRRARQRAREAVLHVLRARGRARAAPRVQGVGRPLQGPVRRRLGRVPRDGVRQPAEDRPAAGRTRSSRRATPTCPNGRRCPPTSVASTPG